MKGSCRRNLSGTRLLRASQDLQGLPPHRPPCLASVGHRLCSVPSAVSPDELWASAWTSPAPKEQRWVSQVQLWLLQWRPLQSPSFPRHSVAVHQYVDTAFLRVLISTRTDESRAGLAVKQLRELESCPRTSFPTPSHSMKAALMLPTAAQRQGCPSPPPYVPYLRSWDSLWHSVGV